MKTKIEIKSRFTGNVIFQFEAEDNTVNKTVEEAVKSRADLSGAVNIDLVIASTRILPEGDIIGYKSAICIETGNKVIIACCVAILSSFGNYVHL